jgi:hypothetical protein
MSENQQPPPNYPPPPPGYPSPSQYPPLPGYPGYTPPGYIPPQPGYVPPPVQPNSYAGTVPAQSIPPTTYFARVDDVPLGYPSLAKKAPPKTGTIWQAWYSIATDISRTNIASWANGARDGWVSLSISIYILITIVANVFSMRDIKDSFLGNIRSQEQAFDSADAYSSLIHWFETYSVHFVIGLVISATIFAFIAIFNTALWQAMFMPQTLGTFGERYKRAIKPFVLALMGPAILNLATAFLSFILGIIGGPIALAFAAILSLISLAAIVYNIAIFVQAGSVGTTLNRWYVFGIAVLGMVVFAFVFSIILIIPIAIILSATIS